MNILSRRFLLGLFSLMHFQLATVLEIQQEEELLRKWEGYNETNSSRTIRKARANLFKSSSVLDEQFEELCVKVGHQPCTCYYPDHANIVKLELGMDKFAKNAVDENGTGPGSCQDLKNLGYILEGFYMVRFNSKRLETINCNFNNETIENIKKRKKNIKEKFTKEVDSRRPGKSVIRFCGGVRGKQCTYLYSDYPDAKQVRNAKVGQKYPSSCEDLQLIGHTLQGFHMVLLNTNKVKIVYCDFKSQAKDVFKAVNSESISNLGSKNKSLYCNGLGSQPCSRYYSKSPNISQFELSNDDRTREALKNGPTDCADLETIGHNLTGFYIVRTNALVLNTIFCEFLKTLMTKYDSRLPLQTTPASFETSVARMTTSNIDIVEKKSSNDIQNTIKNNAIITSIPKRVNEGLPIKPLGATESFKNENLVLVPKASKVLEYTTIKSTKIVPSSHDDNKNFLLMNKHNKCMSTRRLNQYEVGVVQSNCNPKEKEQLWKWVGDYLRNEFGFVSKVQKGMTYFQVHLYPVQAESEWVNQKWHATDEGKIVSNTGLCLSVENDSEFHDVVLSMNSCEKKENGQFWDRIPQPN